MSDQNHQSVDPEREDDGDNDSFKSKKPITHDERGAADLERVTDNVREKELNFDADAVKAVSGIAAASQKDSQLFKVKVKADEVAFLCQELEVSKTVAERLLKEHQGNLFDTLIDYVK